MVTGIVPNFDSRALSIVDVHEEKDDSALEVALDVVDDDLLADIDELNVREGRVLDGLVVLFVARDARVKVLHGAFWVPVDILLIKGLG